MKNVYFLSAVISIFYLSSLSIRAEFDTLWTKNDYRLSVSDFEVINDSIILTSIWMKNDANSSPNIDGNYKNLVKYNINSMTYTNVFDVLNQKLSHLYIDFVVSDDKSKLLLLKTNNQDMQDSLYIYNITNGDLDTVLTFGEYDITRNIKKSNDGKISFIVSSSTITEYGKNQKLIGQLDLDNYNIDYLLVPDQVEMGERGVYDHEIIKSYRDGIEQEVIFYCHQLSTFEILSYPFVADLKSQDSFWYYYVDDYSGINKLKYLNNFEYLVYNIDIESNRNLIVQESIKGININKNFKTKIDENSPTILGSDNSDNNLFIGYSGSDYFNLSIYDVEKNAILDKMYLNLSQHPFLTAGERAINRIKAINDSVYISVIAGTIIKFEVKDYELSVNKEITDYYLFPTQQMETLFIILAIQYQG